MNVAYKLWCRVFQLGFKVGSPVLPWRKPELISGPGSVSKLPAFIAAKGDKKVLVITGKTSWAKGRVKVLYDGLIAEGIEPIVYHDTVPNPTITNIEEAVKMYNENGCTAIIAFGGGSPQDCAKGVGARIARPNKTIPQMKGLFKVLKRIPTLYAIPTTAGSGSETTIAAVISNSETHEKYPVNDICLIPRYAVLDPLTTVSLPPHVTSTTGMDTLTHSVEAFIGRSNTRETREMAIESVKLVFENLKKAYDDGQNIEARHNMQLASYYGGVAFTRAYVGYVHAIAHTLGGMYDVAHGLANAVILPHMLEYYGESCHKALAELADNVGITEAGDSIATKANKFIAAIKELNASMEIPTTFTEIQEKDIPLMVKRAQSEGNPLYPVPKLMGVEDMTAMYYQLKAKA